MTAEDAATVDQREAERRELRQLRALYAAAQDEIASFRQREDALASELAEAHDWQAATAEILRIIASPRSELSHVLEAMAERAYRLCGATSARVYLIDGDVLRSVTSVAESDLALGDAAPVAVPGYTARLSRQNMVGRAVLDGRVVHIEDADRPDVREEFPSATLGPGFPRTRLHVPLGRDGAAIGVLAVARLECAPFSEAEIALLEAFADQAVIAIENARLFEALEQRNREVTEALEQQTATAEVLRVIASSPTDLQTVLRTIAENAARLCGANDAIIHQIDVDDRQYFLTVVHYGPVPHAFQPGSSPTRNPRRISL